MIRNKISEPWREVSWHEAISHAASELKRIQARYGKPSIGGITSSRCTDEETFLVQKLIRGGFGTNNVDTCAPSAIRRPVTAYRRPSAPRRAPRISIRSRTPTS
jgi:predicted molibdopterin-dependent oxidoreductase YjgC